MDAGQVFSDSLQLVWRRKFLWLFGLGIGINGLASGLLRLFLRPLLPETWFDPQWWLDRAQSGEMTFPTLDFSMQTWGMVSLGGVFTIFLYVVVFWIVVTVSGTAVNCNAPNS